MSNQPRTRQELYDLIRESSKEEFILAEMKRLGFWKSSKEMPSLPEHLITRRGELNRELRELFAKERKIKNPEQLLKEYRNKRLKESREKQVANREQRAKDRALKAAQWKARKTQEILYLGQDISKGLNQQESDAERLAKFGLPRFATVADLAQAMNITVGQLRFLSYQRKVSKVSHYQRFYLQKKSGGKRLISAPMPRLKTAQYWVLENILAKVGVHEQAHGFAPERSILTNAQDHIGQDLVINFDFKDFFPTITYVRVKGVFKNLGYSDQMATIFAALCSEPDVEKVKMDGQSYYVSQGERHLPQGAPTSPVLTNILCFRLDKRLAGMAQSLDFKYSRYADDLSFSTSGAASKNWLKLKWRVQQICKDEGFVLHPDKLRVMRKGNRQEVTGLIVNEQLGIDRRTLRKFRALLHQIRRDGWEGKQWGKSKNLQAAIWGYANFVKMVKPDKGQQLLEEVKALIGPAPQSAKPTSFTIPTPSNKPTDQSPKGKAKDKGEEDKPFWKLW